MNLAPTGGPGLGRWVPHVWDKRCFSFGWKQLTAGGRLPLPPTPLSPPNCPITSNNSQATLHLHRQLLRLLLASCARSTAIDQRHGLCVLDNCSLHVAVKRQFRRTASIVHPAQRVSLATGEAALPWQRPGGLGGSAAAATAGFRW